MISSCGSSPHAWGTQFGIVTHAAADRFIPTRVGNTSAIRETGTRRAVHPHTRGEHAIAGSPNTSIDGSSPHAWGTHLASTIPEARHRFIPTRVGNTYVRSTASILSAVHPHTRGEHDPLATPGRTAPGSSPHAWGTLGRDFGGEGLYRFIPTRVGNTTVRPIWPFCVSVHPHTRGEHWRASCDIVPSSGSSPHAWGTRLEMEGELVSPRFIPTRVGNTLPSSR